MYGSKQWNYTLRWVLLHLRTFTGVRVHQMLMTNLDKQPEVFPATQGRISGCRSRSMTCESSAWIGLENLGSVVFLGAASYGDTRKIGDNKVQKTQVSQLVREESRTDWYHMVAG